MSFFVHSLWHRLGVTSTVASLLYIVILFQHVNNSEAFPIRSKFHASNTNLNRIIGRNGILSPTKLDSSLLPRGGTAKPKKKNLKSFVRYLEIECWKRAELRELEPVLQAVAESCRQINRIVQRAQTDDLYGVALGANGLPLEDTNIQGEVQQQLDVLCNTMMLRAFCGCSSAIHAVASEEEDEPRCCSDVMVCRTKLMRCFENKPRDLGILSLEQQLTPPIFLDFRLIMHSPQVTTWQSLTQLMAQRILMHLFQSVAFSVSTGSHLTQEK